MAIKKYKATSPGLRSMSSIDTKGSVTKSKPEKSLTKKLTKSGGRNSYGRTTVRFRGGGARRRYRQIDFKRDKDQVPGKIAAIEYDPNRTAFIALVNYADGEKRYILAPRGLKVGDVIESGENVDSKVGNSMPLANIPVGTMIHNIELKPGKGGQIARSAGARCQLIAKEGKFAQVRMPSGEFRLIHLTCRATIGVVGNESHELVRVGKAGKTRHLGRRPRVRGSAMNPVDHPHGGGEGRAPIGRPEPRTPWGKKTRGVKTRRKKNKSNKYIVRGRVR